MPLLAELAVLLSPLLVSGSSDPAPLALHLSAKQLSNKTQSVTDLPSPSPAQAKFSWLGCLELTASGEHASLFGGLSGAYLHGSRMIAVSDTTKLNKPPWWGAGRLFRIDLQLEQAKGLKGTPTILPVGVKSASVQCLRDRFGKELVNNKQYGDTESVAVEWPHDMFVGIERTHVLRHYKFQASPSGDELKLGTPEILGGNPDDLTNLTGVGAELSKCKDGGGNHGAEAVTAMPNGDIVVFCEHNLPGSTSSQTVGWLADRDTGAIKGTYTLPLPELEGSHGTFFRISGADAVPGTSDILVLFHYWSGPTGNFIKVARSTIAEDKTGDASKPIILEPTVLLELKEKDGFPMDNWESIIVEAIPEYKGSYVVHLLSDDNFNPAHQRTLLFSMHMQETEGADDIAQKYSKDMLGWQVSKLVYERAFQSIGLAIALTLVALGLKRFRSRQSFALYGHLHTPAGAEDGKLLLS